jgi:hypothetical protein
MVKKCRIGHKNSSNIELSYEKKLKTAFFTMRKGNSSFAMVKNVGGYIFLP